jgi:hypothetical protein
MGAVPVMLDPATFMPDMTVWRMAATRIATEVQIFASNRARYALAGVFWQVTLESSIVYARRARQ